MEENYLTEGTFKASMDSIISQKFGEGYTLQDVGELVELTEMTLEDRVSLIENTIERDFTELSKSLDSIQKSLYDMLGLLTDTQVDLGKANESGGITDADVNKIVEGLHLEEKFFPHLYQYLDEKFGLDAEKVKNFRAKTETVIGGAEGEAGEVREGRSASTAEINKKMGDSADPKKAGRKAFEDQNVFSQRLKLWTEGHKEPSKQEGDDKKDKKSDDESLLSKIIKVGMIAGMIMDILMKSPEIIKFFSDTWDKLKEKLIDVWNDLKASLGGGLSGAFESLWKDEIQPYLSQKFDMAEQWFKETFPEVYEKITTIASLIEGVYLSTMTDEQQEKYAEQNPDSDLAIWRKMGGGQLHVWDLGQYSRAFGGTRGDYLREMHAAGLDEKLKDKGGIEQFADISDTDFSYNDLFYVEDVSKKLTADRFAQFLSTLSMPDKLRLPGDSWKDRDFVKTMVEYGAVFEHDWANNKYYLKNFTAAKDAFVKKHLPNIEAEHEATKTVEQISVENKSKVTSVGDTRTESEKRVGEILDADVLNNTQKQTLIALETRQSKMDKNNIPTYLQAPPTKAERIASAVYNITNVKFEFPSRQTGGNTFGQTSVK